MTDQLPFVNAKLYALDIDFLLPYLAPHGDFVDQAYMADCILTMNSSLPNAVERLSRIRQAKRPIAWWTIEDPNSFTTFLPQAARADFVFTTDEACIPHYVERLGHNRVFWLPLACAPAYHFPQELHPDAQDFVVSANWYTNEARLWGVKTVVDPLLRANYSLALYAYDTFQWPARYQPFWRGGTSCRTVADQYRQGRVVLGLNNQRSGMDGRAHTVMTSMRTFEALACGKPLLAAQSDAYERLGFIQGEHLVWVARPEETLQRAVDLLGADGGRIAANGRAFVLNQHTYAHRLARIADIVFA